MKKKRLVFFIGGGLVTILLCYFSLFFYPKKSTISDHFSTKGSYFKPVTIAEFSSSKIPRIAFKIGEEKVLLELDLGFNSELSLPPSSFQIVKKTFAKSKFHYGFKGKKYHTDVYTASEIGLGGITFHNARVEEENLEFSTDAILWGDKKNELYGKIGWGLFYLTNLFLDCEHSTIAFCDSLKTLREQGYPVDNFVEAPLLLNNNMIEFEAKTAGGKLRCLLDTGATINILNCDKIESYDLNNTCEIPSFKIAGHDFGPTSFMCAPLKLPFKVDAIIGMEFIHSKLIFIDFPNRKIYFGSSAKIPKDS